MNSDQKVSAGMYFYTIQAGKFRQTKEDDSIKIDFLHYQSNFSITLII